MRNKNILSKTMALTMATVMTIGCAMPVFAKDTSITKDETVYVVLNSDGSIKSQTVSDHLHSDSGLASVTDLSTLQNIQNTQSEAAYTQNGTALTWNTSDTDVYYKGDSNDTPPITAAVTYKLDGTVVSAEELAGKSGHLIVSVALTNNTVETIQVGTGETARSRAVCTPFAAVVGTMLDEDTYQNVTADHGLVQSDGGSSIVGFVAMPGMKACLSDLLPNQLSNVNDYLMDVVTFEADVTDATAPNLMIAVAADAGLLKDESGKGMLGDLDELDGLQDDLDKLTDAVDQLTDGASQLNNGVGNLRNGAKTLSDSTTTLYSGTTTLKSVTVTLAEGAATLNNGASQLYSGACTLKDGTGQMRGGAATLADGANTLDGGLGNLSNGLAALTSKNDTLNSGAQQIADAILKTANTQLKAAGAISEDMTWSNYADVLSAALGVNDEMRAAAKETLRQQVKEKTGTDLTDEQLNCLVYMTAVAMGADSSKTLEATVTEVGNKMTTAQSDASGCIGDAQAALKASNNNPLDVPEVKALMENLALNSVLAQITGVDENTAKLVLILAAQNSTGDLSADLAAQAQPLNDAKEAAAAAQAAQAALAAKGGNHEEVPEVLALLEKQALQTIYAGISAPDDTTKGLLLTMAADALNRGNELDLTTAVTNAAAKATAVQNAQTALAGAGGDAKKVDDVQTMLTAVQAAQKLDSTDEAYAALATQVGQDDDTNKLIITMAAQDMEANSRTDVDNMLGEAGAKAVATKTAQTEMAGGVISGNVKTLLDTQYVHTAYTTIADNVGSTDENNALIITMAALAIAGGSETDSTTALANAGAAAQKAQAAQATLAGAQAVLDGADGNMLAIADVKNVLDAQCIASAYDEVAGATGQTDPAVNALLITMAAKAMAADSSLSVSDALTNNGSALSNANEVQTAMAKANGDAEAAALMTAFLTKLVSTASEEQLKQIEELNSQLASVQGFVEGLKTYTAGVATAADGAASAKDGSSKLAAGANTLNDGIIKADDGAATLRDGLSTLYGGTGDLVSGVAQLNIGATTLQSGAGKLSSGALTLYNGTGDLKNGTQKLVDGVNQLNDEGISKLTDSVDADSLETLKDVADAMKDRQDAYTSYSGAPENVSASVKFVMKTGENPVPVTTTDSTTDTTATAEKTSLWQKILNLFSFGKK